MKRIVILAALAIAATACGNKTQEFAADDGSVRATVNVNTNEWKITKADGSEVVTDYDSMRVVQVSEDGHPMTIVYYTGNRQHWIQYYSTMHLRSEGDMVNGAREGRWVFYHPNGNIQSECTYVNGLEEGPYHVYRDNGIPYYIGQYSAGQRTGRWEIYDNEGTLAETKDYTPTEH